MSRKPFDPYDDNLNLEDYVIDDDDVIDDDEDGTYIPSLNSISGGNYKYDDEQWN